ncbi:MAG: hypothetical protein H5U02_07465 [Clostridia bacterium]|nr:hypothetical protein [Clostridia bacterium]
METINGYLRAIRSFFNFLVREKVLAESPMAGIPLVKGRKTIIQTFSEKQLATLLRMPDKSRFSGYRDYLMMLVLLDTGISKPPALTRRFIQVAIEELLKLTAPVEVAFYLLICLEPVIKELQKSVTILTVVVARQGGMDKRR